MPRDWDQLQYQHDDDGGGGGGGGGGGYGTGMTEFEFKCCRNPTIFLHLNLLDLQRQFLVEFEFGFSLRNGKLFSVPGLQKSTKW